MAPLYKPTCIFYARGACRNGDSCSFVHERDTGAHDRSRPVIPVWSPPQAPKPSSNVTPTHEAQGRTTENLPRSPDSRNTVLCRFFSQSRGCQKESCPFLHVTQGPQSVSINNEELALKEDEVSSQLLKLQRPDAHAFRRNLMISVGLSMEHPYISTNAATFSRFRFRQTIPLHASQVSRPGLPPKQLLTPCTD